jgi:hypothetical protein
MPPKRTRDDRKRVRKLHASPPLKNLPLKNGGRVKVSIYEELVGKAPCKVDLYCREKLTRRDMTRRETDVNFSGVQEALQRDDVDTLKIFLGKSGAEKETWAKGGMGCLAYAVYYGSFKCLKWMVEEEGMDISVRSAVTCFDIHCKGLTLMHILVIRRSKEIDAREYHSDCDILEFLFRNKLKPSDVSEGGFTVMHLVCMRNDEWMFKKLLWHCDGDKCINDKDSRGESAMDYALYYVSFRVEQSIIPRLTKIVEELIRYEAVCTFTPHCEAFQIMQSGCEHNFHKELLRNWSHYQFKYDAKSSRSE